VSARPLAVTLALLAAPIQAGCGAADRAPDATAVARGFQTAIDREDGATACEQLGEETKSSLESDEGKPCEEAILGLELPSGTEVSRARVYVGSASVAVPDGTTVFLDESSDRWEVSAAGCTPTEPDQPLDCDLED
jgi:hypothetical protein